MNIVYERCAGLDVHKKTVVACALTPDEKGQRQKQRCTFSTMTPDLLKLRAWLQAQGVTHVAMESTGSYWKPVFNLLEGYVDVMVVNAQHLKTVAFAQNGHQRCRMDRRFVAAWAPAPQFHSSRATTGGP